MQSQRASAGRSRGGLDNVRPPSPGDVLGQFIGDILDAAGGDMVRQSSARQDYVSQGVSCYPSVIISSPARLSYASCNTAFRAAWMGNDSSEAGLGGVLGVGRKVLESHPAEAWWLCLTHPRMHTTRTGGSVRNEVSFG